jgi:hypothetical protein
MRRVVLAFSLAAGFVAPLVAFAQPPLKDFVVGGGRIGDCVNFAVSAHSDADTVGNAKGSITQVRPAACGEPAGYKAQVVCLEVFVDAVLGDVAIIAANYLASHGSFTPDGHVVAAFVDRGNPRLDGPVDFVAIADNVAGSAPPGPSCNTILSVGDLLMLSNGNVSVHLATP